MSGWNLIGIGMFFIGIIVMSISSFFRICEIEEKIDRIERHLGISPNDKEEE